MIVVNISQGYNEIVFETEFYSDAELLVNTITSVADNRTKITISTTEETEASKLQKEKEALKDNLREKTHALLKAEAELKQYREAEVE